MDMETKWGFEPSDSAIILKDFFLANKAYGERKSVKMYNFKM